MPLAIGRGQLRDHRQRGRDRGDAQLAAQAAAQRLDLVAHGAAVADDAPRPFEHPFAFGREALEPRAAVDQQDAHLLFELLDPGRQGRLGHPARLGGMAEMLFSREGEDIFELVEHAEPAR